MATVFGWFGNAGKSIEVYKKVTDGGHELHATDEDTAEVVSDHYGVRVLVRKVGCEAIEGVLKSLHGQRDRKRNSGPLKTS